MSGCLFVGLCRVLAVAVVAVVEVFSRRPLRSSGLDMMDSYIHVTSQRSDNDCVEWNNGTEHNCYLHTSNMSIITPTAHK